MNIRPKNTILFAWTGVKFSQNNLRGANWRQQVFNNYRQHLLDQLTKYGEAQDYGQWLNEMQSRHANIYNLAGGEKGNWEDVAYKNDLVGQYQQDYRGGLGNDGQYKRYGSVQINDSDRYDFNQGISPNFNSRYNIANPPSRYSGDNTGKKYVVDNLYSAITDDRRLLGRKGDWDETSEDYKQWQKELNDRGWETFLDKDNYYKLRRIGTPDPQQNDSQQNPQQINPQQNPQSQNSVIAQQKFDKEPFINKLQAGFNKIAPDLLDVLRLAGNMHNNERVYNESMKAIIPNLQQSFHTHRQVFGDEATKQAYYRRAVQGQSQAAKPFTSDADKQIAYQMEAKRIGDELRAQGDLADNQRIRETSAESAAHADANIERDTAVANNNLTELIKARAAKHQLTAQKYSADWTNIDQFLLGRQARLEQKKAEEKNINRQLAMLNMQEDLLGNTTLSDLKYQREKAYNDYMSNTDESKSEQLRQRFNDLNIKYQKAQIQAQRDAINKYKLYAKSGTKLTYKDNTSKYLYKVSRDVVEHFRKMSRMTDDSRVRTLPKTVKLNSSPKKKLQLGGTAPFTIYRPLGPTGETSFTNTNELGGGSSKSSSTKDTAAKDKLDMIKELFKSVQGLPIDVTSVYQRMVGVLNKAKALGEEMTTDDIAAMYLNSMNDLARLKYSQKAYEDARSVAVGNDALSETAVGANGELILQNLETGEVKVGTMSELKKSEGKLNALTNEQALTMRAHSPNLAFNDRIFDIVNNGIGMSKIANHIKSLAGTIGSMETKIEGITQVESNKIKAGLKELAEAPDGYYKISTDTKDSSANVNAALEYIYGALPKNYRTILEMNSNGQGKKLIASFLTSQTSGFVKEDITPLTGKASDKTKSGGSSDELEMNNALRLLTGAGGSHLQTFGIGNNNVIQAYGRQATIADTTSNESAFGADFSYNDIYKSGVGRILDLDNASFGDVPINKAMKDSIIVDNSKIVGIDLPYRTGKDGRIIPDFAMLKKVEEADQEVLNQNLDPNKESDINKINQIYASKGLPIKYGGPTQLTGNYMRFAVIQATASEDAFLTKDGLSSNGTLTLVTDDNEIEKYVRLMQGITKDKKYSLDKPGISWGNKDVYKGSIFIPITGDITDAALSGGGSKIKTGMTQDYDTMNRAWYTRNYIAPKEENFNK